MMQQAGILFWPCCGWMRIAAGAPLSMVGSSFFPVVLLNLDDANHTDTKCVTWNGRDLCTTIDYCPQDAYACQFLDPQKGHSCEFATSECGCTATYGEGTCRCNVLVHVPHTVAAGVQNCEESLVDDEEPGFSRLDSTNADCFDPIGFYYGQFNETACYRGSARFRASKHLFDVNWECSRDSNDKSEEETGGIDTMSLSTSNLLEPERDCSCQARYGYQECTECQLCPKDTPGEFRAVCPGFFMDCYQVYSVWKTDTDSSSSDGIRGSWWALAMLSIILLVLL